jgi:sodium/proline symporter
MNSTVVLITLIAYKLLLVAIGIWASRRSHSEDEFFLGGRTLGPVVASVSYAASAASAWTLLGVSGVAYMIGISAIWIALGAVLGCAIAWIWLAPRMMAFSHREQILTTTEFLAHGHDGVWRARIISSASAIILLSFIFYISSQFQGAGNTFASTFDISMANSIILGGSIIMLYTLLGGFWAVSVTDTLQGILMLFTAVLLPVTAWYTIGGWDAFWQGLQAVSSPDQLSLTGKNVGLLAAGVVVGNLATGIGTFGQPHLLARFMAVRDARALGQARIIAISWYAIVFIGMCFLGLAGHVLAPDLANPETIFFHLTELLFSPFIAAILLAAILSAIMSTADSMLLVSAAAVAHDLGLAARFPGRELLLSRLVIGVICALAISVAIYLPESIFTRVLFAWIAIGSAFGPPVIARLAGWLCPAPVVLAAMLSGFGLAIVFYLLPNTPGDIVERLLPFTVASLILLVGRKKN